MCDVTWEPLDTVVERLLDGLVASGGQRGIRSGLSSGFATLPAPSRSLPDVASPCCLPEGAETRITLYPSSARHSPVAGEENGLAGALKGNGALAPEHDAGQVRRGVRSGGFGIDAGPAGMAICESRAGLPTARSDVAMRFGIVAGEVIHRPAPFHDDVPCDV